MIRKYLLPFLAIAGLGAAIFMVIQGNRTVSVVQPAVQSAQAPFTSSIFGPGIVEASSENIAIGTPVSGIVAAIYVKWDERVKAGAPLFKVDTRDLEAQRLPARFCAAGRPVGTPHDCPDQIHRARVRCRVLGGVRPGTGARSREGQPVALVVEAPADLPAEAPPERQSPDPGP